MGNHICGSRIWGGLSAQEPLQMDATFGVKFRGKSAGKTLRYLGGSDMWMARSGSGLSVVFACISPRFWHPRTCFATRNVSPNVSPLAIVGLSQGVAKVVPGNLAGEGPVVTQGSPLGLPRKFAGTGVALHINATLRACMGHYPYRA